MDKGDEMDRIELNDGWEDIGPGPTDDSRLVAISLFSPSLVSAGIALVAVVQQVGEEYVRGKSRPIYRIQSLTSVDGIPSEKKT